jgi:GT2 family glycosyltransferase
MRFEPDCVRRLVEVLEADPESFSADPLQFNWTGEQVVHYRTVLRPPCSARELVFRVMLPWPPRVGTFAPASEVVEIPWGCAGSMLVRREMFEALEGFDPRFFLDFEDLDLCWRAWRRGWKTYFVPTARLYHRVAATTDAALAADRPEMAVRVPSGDAGRLASQQRNHQRFVLKTMDLRAILMFHALKFAALLAYAAAGRWRIVAAMLRAWQWNLRNLRDTLAARRALASAASLDDGALLRRFGVYADQTADTWPARTEDP